jgi:hypothetical protein
MRKKRGTNRQETGRETMKILAEQCQEQELRNQGLHGQGQGFSAFDLGRFNNLLFESSLTKVKLL